MAEDLFLRLSETKTEWMLLDKGSGIVRFRGEGDFNELTELVADMALSGSTYVMLCGEEILLTSAVIPSKQKRQILQAVPFMVEESLATDIAECHFAIGDRNENGDVRVAIIEKTRLEYWLDCLQDAGLKPDVLTVDTLSVPHQSGCTILVDGDRALIKFGVSSGFAIETNLVATSVDLLADEAKENIRLLVHESQKETIELIVSQINAEQDADIEIVELEYLPFEFLSRSFDTQAINLLQGEFKVDRKGDSGEGAWRSVAILAGCAFVLHIALLLGRGMYFDLTASQFEAETQALYSEVFPNDRNVRDIRRRWQWHINQGSSDNGGEFLSLFGETVQNIPGSNLVLNNVNYNESRGDLILQLETSRSELLILFSQTLTKLGLNAEIGTINQGEDSVRGSIKVKALGAR